MMSSKIYLFNQRHRVILLDTSGAFFSKRYNQVYTKNLIAHKGTDNQILIEFVNQDQKRVDVTGMQFTCRIISHDGEKLLLEKPLESVNDTEGQTKLVLTEQELDDFQSGLAGFSVEQISTGKPYEPVYVDDSAGARGVIDIRDSIMPAFTLSKTLTIPDHGILTQYVSSLLNTEDTDLHTFQLEMDQYTGVINIEGATDTDDLWYTIQTENLVLADLLVFNINGFHPYLRFNITDDVANTGSITKITHR